MNPRVVEVKAQTDYTLLILFKNGEQKIFNLRPYLDIGVFKSLKNSALFATARAQFGTVVWQNEVDFDPDTLYLESKPISSLNSSTNGNV